MVQIKWLKSARNDLKEIADYIGKDSIRYAQRQVLRIVSKTSILKTQPKIGKVVRELNKKDILEIQEGKYRIIYRIVSNNQVDVLLIHHGARKLPRIK